MARILGVQAFGQFSEALLVSSTFCMLACLGLQPMLQRDMPIMFVRRRVRVAVVAATQCIVIAAGCFLVSSVLTLVAGASILGIQRATIMSGLLHGLSQQVFLIATIESRSRGQPIRYAGQNLIRGFLIFSGGILAALTWRSALGVILVEAGVSLAMTSGILFGMFRSVHLSAAVAYQLSIMRVSRVRWGSAGALLIVTTIGFVLLNVDRWIAAKTLSQVQFSNYAFAWTLLTIAQAIQIVLNASVFPFLARTYASAGLASTYRLCLKLSCVLLICGAIALTPAIVLSRYGVVRWFPAYRDSLSLVALFLLVGAVRTADFWSSFMMIVGRERQLIVLNVVAVTVSFIVWTGYLNFWSEGRTGLWEIGMLAAILSVCNYLLTAGAAWRARLA
jgi:O-antigen/teichoic acid export membrane protein